MNICEFNELLSHVCTINQSLTLCLSQYMIKIKKTVINYIHLMIMCLFEKSPFLLQFLCYEIFIYRSIGLFKLKRVQQSGCSRAFAKIFICLLCKFWRAIVRICSAEGPLIMIFFFIKLYKL